VARADKTKIMEPHVERLVIEKHELEIKHDKLIQFLHSSLWQELDSHSKQLLTIQLRAMQTYLECLEQRLKNY
jgi:hypothetical protein